MVALCAAKIGDEIVWNGRRYRISEDGADVWIDGRWQKVMLPLVRPVPLVFHNGEWVAGLDGSSDPRFLAEDTYASTISLASGVRRGRVAAASW